MSVVIRLCMSHNLSCNLHPLDLNGWTLLDLECGLMCLIGKNGRQAQSETDPKTEVKLDIWSRLVFSLPIGPSKLFQDEMFLVRS
jgi:hypothetical protein